MSCLYILEINLLSVDSFANIFSYSEDCLEKDYFNFNLNSCMWLMAIELGGAVLESAGEK